jgi:DNA mismatch repair ATPase MutS
MGHPLIPDETRISNDFTLQHLGELALVTGSNMSGKSTFLRTLGVNLCLAFAGGPVCAAGLQTIPFRLFTCINVSDSLNDGISYFYAEVRRLKVLLDELNADQPLPLFFLIDEIFRGTNNRERQIGSRSYVEALVGGHGVGAISTHDLELIHLAEQMPGIKNYHFREEVRDGRMIFDYRLRPGPSPTTNALKIMKLEGLPVQDAETSS